MIDKFVKGESPLTAEPENPSQLRAFVESWHYVPSAARQWSRTTRGDRAALLTHFYDFIQDDTSRGYRHCIGMRTLLAGREGWTREQFLALSGVDDFDGEMPLNVQSYLALYFDMEKGRFTSEAFYTNYQEGNQA